MNTNLYRLIKNNKNKNLENKIHLSGVPFERKTIYSNGCWVNLVVPIFNGYTINIGHTVEELWKKVRSSTKHKCLQTTIDQKAYNLAIDLSFYKLRELYQKSPYRISTELINFKWKESQIQELEGSLRCDPVTDITSHHLPETNIDDNTINMQFVFSVDHKAGHSGGSQCWNINKLEICGTYDPVKKKSFFF